MQTFRTLELAIQFYGLARKLKLPAHHRDQLVRAASSVALNLSEGNGNPNPRNRRVSSPQQFISILFFVLPPLATGKSALLRPFFDHILAMRSGEMHRRASRLGLRVQLWAHHRLFYRGIVLSRFESLSPGPAP